MNQEDDKEKLVSSLWGAERCLRVLESVSVTEFRENQTTSDQLLDPDFGIFSIQSSQNFSSGVVYFAGRRNDIRWI